MPYSAGFGQFLGFKPYGDEFRMLRRYISQYFNSRDSAALHPLLADHVKILLKNLLDNPENFEDHFERCAFFALKVPIFIMMKRLGSGIIVKSTYGRDIASNDDDYVKLATNTTVTMASLGIPGLNPVDLFPFRES